MGWKEEYRKKLTTAEEAVKLIKPGDRISISHAAAEPTHLVDALMANKDAYHNVEIVHMVPMGTCAYARPGMENHFRHNAIFVGAPTRETIKNGHGDYTPCHFSQIPNLFYRTLPLNAALIHVSPPDAHGFCSLGLSVDYSKHAAAQAPVVIAQVNRLMPRTLGDSFVHVSAMTAIVEHDAPLLELAPPVLTEVEKAIAHNCASLINDGDCMQLGIGAIPDAVLLSLMDKNDLGIHSELISDGVADLAKAGVITHKRKNFHQGTAIVTFIMGTKKLYDYVDNNPSLNIYPATYVNDPYVAGKNDNLVSINSCLQVDFLGQVCAETINGVQISGVGGQTDFVRAAAISKGGRSIIAFPSTAAGGSISRIVPFLDPGAAVTTSRNDVEYVITEYGVANLRYRTTRDRARMLIELAHPKFRDALKEAFKRRFNTAF